MSELSFEEKQKMLAGLAEPFPPEVIESRPGGGGKSFQYVKGWAVIERLSHVCAEWSTEVKWRQVQNMELFEWNRQANRNEIVTRPVMMVEIDLTIPGLGTRTGLGVQIMRPGSEDMIKGAWTDALKVAASKFMVAHDLYKGEDVGISVHGDNDGAPVRQPQQAQRQQGGYTPDPATEAQWGLLNRLANKLKIDKDQIAKATVGQPTSGLNKNTISKVIKRLQAIEEGNEHWNPAGNISKAASQESVPPQVDHDGVIHDDGDSDISGWLNNIAKATSGTQLDKIFESMSQYGLASDQRLIDALEARNLELEG